MRRGWRNVVQRSVIAGSIIAFVAAALAAAWILSAVLPAQGHAAAPHGNPAAFVSKVVRLIVADDYDSAWISLYPAHQQVATRSEYVACEQKSPVGSTLRSIDVVRVADRLVHIPGEPQRVRVKAVTLRITLADTLGTRNAFSHTFNVVPAGSQWAWILTPSRYELYRTDGCGE